MSGRVLVSGRCESWASCGNSRVSSHWWMRSGMTTRRFAERRGPLLRCSARCILRLSTACPVCQRRTEAAPPIRRRLLHGNGMDSRTRRVRPVSRWPSCRCRAGGRPEAARRAGLEGVEKVSQLPQQHGHNGAGRQHAATRPLCPRPLRYVRVRLAVQSPVAGSTVLSSATARACSTVRRLTKGRISSVTTGIATPATKNGAGRPKLRASTPPTKAPSGSAP
jgi:hypothetical protein